MPEPVETPVAESLAALNEKKGYSPKGAPRLRMYSNSFGTQHLQDFKKGIDDGGSKSTVLVPVTPQEAKRVSKELELNFVTYQNLVITSDSPQGNEYAVAMELAREKGSSEAQIPETLALHCIASEIIHAKEDIPVDFAVRVALPYLQERAAFFANGNAPQIAEQYELAAEYCQNLIAAEQEPPITLAVTNYCNQLQTTTSRNLSRAIQQIPEKTVAHAIVLPPQQTEIRVKAGGFNAPTYTKVQPAPEAAIAFANAVVAAPEIMETDLLLLKEGQVTRHDIAEVAKQTAKNSVPEIAAIEATRAVAEKKIPPEFENQEAIGAEGFQANIEINGKFVLLVAGNHAQGDKQTANQLKQCTELLKTSFESADKYFPESDFTKDPDAALKFALAVFERNAKDRGLDATNLSIYFHLGTEDYLVTIGKSARILEIDLRDKGSARIVLPEGVAAQKYCVTKYPSVGHIGYLLMASDTELASPKIVEAIKDKKENKLEKIAPKSRRFALRYLAPEKDEINAILDARLSILENTFNKIGSAIDIVLAFRINPENPTEFDTHALTLIRALADNLKGFSGKVPMIAIFLNVVEAFEHADNKFIAFIGNLNLKNIITARATIAILDRNDLPLQIYDLFDKLIEFVRARQEFMKKDKIVLAVEDQIHLIDTRKQTAPDRKIDKEQGAFTYERKGDNGFRMVVVGSPEAAGDEESASFCAKIIERFSDPIRSGISIDRDPQGFLTYMMQSIQTATEIALTNGLPPFNMSIFMQIGGRTFIVRSGNGDAFLLEQDSIEIVRPPAGKTVAMGLQANAQEPNWIISEVTTEATGAANVIIAGNTLNENLENDLPTRWALLDALKKHQDPTGILQNPRQGRPDAFVVIEVSQNVITEQAQERLLKTFEVDLDDSNRPITTMLKGKISRFEQRT